MDLALHENSPLRYPGGKARRATRLLRLADRTRCHYVEPFAGGLGMFFRARRERLFRTYHVNDIDADLMNFWTILRDRPDELINALWTTYSRHGAGSEDLFHQAKERLASGNELFRAIGYYLVNKWSVRGDIQAGMIRTTKRRNGISPISLTRLSVFSDLLQGVMLTNHNYREVDIPRDAFAFLDPPYENTGITLYHHPVNLTDFTDWATQLNCSWMITLNDSGLTNELFAGFDRVVEPLKYSVACNPHLGKFESPRTTEIIVMNYQRATRDAFVRQFGWSVRTSKGLLTQSAHCQLFFNMDDNYFLTLSRSPFSPY